MITHFEGLGDKWHCLIDNPRQELPAMVTAVVADGGTRDAWKRLTTKHETMLLAFPPTAAIRGGVVVQGKPGEQLSPKTIFPLLEGVPNDMTVHTVHPWPNGVEGAVAAARNEDGNPLWFYTPTLFRDAEDLTPGVRQTFLLAGLAMGLRRALVDEMTITEGPEYEQYAAVWLVEHPGSTRLDVPQLSVPLAGSRILSGGQYACDYQLRAPITSVETTNFGPQTVYMLHLQFGLNTPNPLDIVLYAPERICHGYVPKAEDEVDAYIWLQGRMLDF